MQCEVLSGNNWEECVSQSLVSSPEGGTQAFHRPSAGASLERLSTLDPLKYFTAFLLPLWGEEWESIKWIKLLGERLQFFDLYSLHRHLAGNRLGRGCARH